VWLLTVVQPDKHIAGSNTPPAPALCVSCCCPRFPCQAFTAAMGALQHGPTNAKAWLRLADSCKAAGRWQLAHLLYSTAVDELGLDDDAVRVRACCLFSCCVPAIITRTKTAHCGFIGHRQHVALFVEARMNCVIASWQ
jgi:hypothetical protein